MNILILVNIETSYGCDMAQRPDLMWGYVYLKDDELCIKFNNSPKLLNLSYSLRSIMRYDRKEILIFWRSHTSYRHLPSNRNYFSILHEVARSVTTKTHEEF
jgi:hypothetical protein